MKPAFLVFALLFVGSLSYAQSDFAESAAPITNFDSFGPGLYRGARPSTVADMQYLQEIGVKSVIDLQGGDIGVPVIGEIFALSEPGESPKWIAYEKATLNSLGLGFVNLPLSSWQDVTRHEAALIRQALSLLANENNRPIFIHCEHGRDRTGLVVALYRVLYQGWTPTAAHQEMVSLGHSGIGEIITHEMDDFFWKAAREWHVQ